MPVTVRYEDDGSGYSVAAVYATIEEAEAQAKHDEDVLGRKIRDIIDGSHTAPHQKNDAKVLRSRAALGLDKGGRRPTQYPLRKDSEA